MKYFTLVIIGIILFTSCGDKENDVMKQMRENCEYKTAIEAPAGYEIKTIGEIDFNGTVDVFQFVNDQTGYAMLSNNVGGYVEVFKTTDGGRSWTDLEIGIDQYPVGMIFRDENYGIITVHDVTGCPPPNCQNKCVILKTEDGGESWEEIEFENLKGTLHHPQYDSEGNLYATLDLDDQSTLLKSVDNGSSWDTLYSSEQLDFTLVTYSSLVHQDRIYISAEDGRIMKINTDGQLIDVIETGNTNIWDFKVLDENNLIVANNNLKRSTNGGKTWETIHPGRVRVISFESIDEGLITLRKSSCPTDVYQVNDLIASTHDGGANWNEAAETTTNMRINFVNSQKMGNGYWLMLIENKLLQIKEN